MQIGDIDKYDPEYPVLYCSRFGSTSAIVIRSSLIVPY